MYKAILPLALLIFIAGCIGSSVRTDSTNGLIVNEFSADPLNPEAGDIVNFFLDVENVGGTTARCITTELFNIDSWNDINGIPLSTLYAGGILPARGLTFNYVDGNFNACYADYTGLYKGGTSGQVCVSRTKDPNTVSVSSFIGNAFGQFTNQFCNSFTSLDPKLMLTQFQSELVPPDPSLGRPGQSRTFSWQLRPPIFPEGTKGEYDVLARTSFFYSTNAVMTVQGFSKEEFRRRANLGQQTEYPLVVQNSFGSPIQVFAEEGESPIIVNPEAIPLSGPLEFKSYKFELANLGDGFPLPMSGLDRPGLPTPTTQSGFIAAVLSVSGPEGVFFSNCLGQTGTEILISPQAISGLVKLRSDQRVPISCTIAVDRSQWVTNEIGTVTFTFSMWYRYYIDKTVHLTVNGVEGLTGTDIVLGRGTI